MAGLRRINVDEMIEVIFFLLLPINIVAQQIVIAPAEEINLDCITETIYFQGFYFDSSGTPYFPIQRTNLRGEVNDESKIFSKMEKEESDFELVKFEGSPVGIKRPDPHEIIIPVGSSEHWTDLIKEYTERVVFCLDEMQTDEL